MFGTLMQFATAPPAIRLARVLNWLGHDLTTLGATAEDDRVIWSHLLRAVLPDDWRTVIPVAPMSEGSLHALHEHLRDDIDAVLHGKPWILPTPSGARCYRTREGLAVVWEGTEETAIPHGLAALVSAHADHVRQCKQCGRLFLANRRQEYDDPACGQTYRNDLKATRAKEAKRRKATRAKERSS
jgi:hypothetical protein